MKSARKSLKKVSVGALLSFALLPLLIGCDGNNSKSAASAPPPTTGFDPRPSIQRTQGLNVGESNSIWTVGMVKPQGDAAQLVLKVVRISLTQGESYKKQNWEINVANVKSELAVSTTGTRTFLSDWGLLIGRGSNTGGHIGMFIVDNRADRWDTLFLADNAADGSRASVFSYRVRNTADNRDYEYVAIAYREREGNIRIERWRVNSTAANFASRFTRLRPYSTAPQKINSNAAIYSGFLYPNCGQNGCRPVFFGGVSRQVDGFDLTVDVPGTPFTTNGTAMATTIVRPPNESFISTSHPKTAAGSSVPTGQYGSINDYAYSMGGDPSDGTIFLSEDQTNSVNNSFLAFDRVNEIAFRVGRDSKMGAAGIDPNMVARPLVTAFKKGCFTNIAPTTGLPDCHPMNTNNSKLFTDVGEDLGPASDLGNGCIAVVGFKRPGEAAANDFKPGIYTACIRDPNDLSKGLSVTKIANGEAATYMYNDFTGASLADRPVNVLFDFSTKKMNGIKMARFYWVPKLGFSETLTGLNMRYRCYPKAQEQNPPAFQNFPMATFPKAATLTQIPNCSGPSINMVEFEFTRIPKSRYTRFELINVTADRE